MDISKYNNYINSALQNVANIHTEPKLQDKSVDPSLLGQSVKATSPFAQGPDFSPIVNLFKWFFPQTQTTTPQPRPFDFNSVMQSTPNPKPAMAAPPPTFMPPVQPQAGITAQNPKTAFELLQERRNSQR